MKRIDGEKVIDELRKSEFVTPMGQGFVFTEQAAKIINAAEEIPAEIAPVANLPAELKPLVNKVAEVLPGLVDAIVEQLPEIINKAIKCGECPYYKNAGPKAVIIRDQFGHEMLGYYEELLEIIFTPIGFLDPEKAKKKGYTVEEITNQPEGAGGTENES